MRTTARAELVAYALFLASFGGACSPEPTEPPSATPTSAATIVPRPTPTPRVVPRRATPVSLRVVRIEGEGQGAVAVGDTLEAGRAVAAGAHHVSLAFERGARIDVEPGARFARSGASSTGLALAAGSMHAILVPEGGSTRPALRIATPRAVLEMNGSGDVFVSALPDGSALVVVLQGYAEVTTGELDAGGRVVSVRVVAGRSVVAGAELGVPAPGPEDLADARAAAARASRGAHRTALAPEESRATLADSLIAHLESFDAEEARGLELRARHREAVDARSTAAASLQGQVIAHAQALLRARRAVRTSFERAEAMAIASEGGTDWLVAQRARVEHALRLGPTASP
jgi:hypothetical protein